MTSLRVHAKIPTGSIDCFTGWPGKRNDDPPSKAPATIPGAKLKTGKSPDALTYSKVN